ncbi:unnamed protein product [Adineta steineri]|uniref:Uncharacterized protein n=1 Tax=Adineta steineri TaxID=433720 RepID=A0A814LMC6_9BILA|nr:unnamed protein product [Adineta steineri]CAF1375323.1 unnamed protein product [Adineta steineri]CAF1415752.1 unnamed protein product [Adineta steineri]CAF1437100.1 unnamed protein product [Adineta steineri]CAF1605467.1 unnamed protein product [Adineta steineri]
MVFNQPKTIFILVLLAIVTTQCLARHAISNQKARDYFHRREMNYDLLKRLLLSQRADTSCPKPYILQGDSCVCAYRVAVETFDNAQYLVNTDHYQAVKAGLYTITDIDGSCGPACPDGYHVIHYSDLTQEFAGYGDNINSDEVVTVYDFPAADAGSSDRSQYVPITMLSHTIIRDPATGAITLKDAAANRFCQKS